MFTIYFNFIMMMMMRYILKQKMQVPRFMLGLVC